MVVNMTSSGRGVEGCTGGRCKLAGRARARGGLGTICLGRCMALSPGVRGWFTPWAHPSPGNKVPWSPRFPLGVRYSSTRFRIVCREERKMSFCSMWHFLTFTFGNQRKGLKSQLAQHPAVQPVILLHMHSWVWAGACLPPDAAWDAPEAGGQHRRLEVSTFGGPRRPTEPHWPHPQSQPGSLACTFAAEGRGIPSS